MQTITPDRIIVLDPGLAAEGGHHVALLETMHRALEEGHCACPVDFFSGRNLSSGVVERYQSDLLGIFPFFVTNLYEHYHHTPSMAAANRYVAELANEYFSALKRLDFLIFSGDGPGPEVTSGGGERAKKALVLYPAMEWTHMMALNLALREFNPQSSHTIVEHRICLMFNPGRDYTGHLYDVSSWLSSRLACKALVEKRNVSLFASDYELAVHYGELLEQSLPLSIHPQYLFHARSRALYGQATREPRTKIGLYFGDAKLEKGFARLPEILDQLMPAIGCHDQVIIQYVSQTDCPRILAALGQILAISRVDSRIKLIPTYLPAGELQATLEVLDIFVFTYDSAHYRNKSSGFLWLLAGMACKVVFPQRSWLFREAQRLGIVSYLSTWESLVSTVRDIIARKSKPASSYGLSSERSELQVYRDQIFYPFVDWLVDGSSRRNEKNFVVNCKVVPNASDNKK